MVSRVKNLAVTTLGLVWPLLWQMQLRGLILEGSNVLEGRSSTKGRESASSLEWGSQSALRWGPARVTLLEQWARGWMLGLSSQVLTSWSRSVCPGPHSCSSRQCCQTARPRPCHSRPRSPRLPSLQTAHGAGPGGQCWAVGRDSTGDVSVFSPQCPGQTHQPRHMPRPRREGAHGRAACGPGARSQPPPHFTLVPQTSCTGIIAPLPKFLSSLEPWNGTLFGTRGSADIIIVKRRSYDSRAGPNANVTGVLIRRQMRRLRHTGTSCDN